MAVNINTVYQRVLTLANKEQRGYITPQEFNLLANQAQMEIFEKYFYDISQVSKVKGNDTRHSDLLTLLEEKLTPFTKRQASVSLIDAEGSMTLPSDLYRINSLVFNHATLGYTEINLVSEEEATLLNKSPLAKPNLTRPIYVRNSSGIKVFPKSLFGYFTQNCDTTADNTSAFADAGGNVASILADQLIFGTGITASNTRVQAIANPVDPETRHVLTLTQAAGSTQSDTTLTFATNSDIVKCNYIAKPTTASWGYNIVGEYPLYNSSTSVDFELHPSEETMLVNTILKMAGIILKAAELQPKRKNQSTSTDKKTK